MTTFYKLFSGVDLSTSYSLDGDNGDPFGVCTDGTYFYIVDNTDAKIYKYDNSFSLQGSYSLDVTNTDPVAICYLNSYFYVTDATTVKIFKYNTSFVLDSSPALDADNDSGYGICTDGTYFYITDFGDNSVYKYDSSFTLIDEFPMLSLNTSPTGIEYYNSKFYIVDFTDGIIYIYDFDFNYKNKVDIITQCYGLCYLTVSSTVYFYLLCSNDDKIYKYAFSQDISSDVINCEINNEVCQIPTGRINVRNQTFEDDDVIQIIDLYTSHYVSDNVQYQGEHNFAGITTTANYYKGSGGLNYETVGTSGTDIDWADSIGGTDSSMVKIIVASEDEHNNVLKHTSGGDNGTYSDIYHTITETDNTIEIWGKYIDNGVGRHTFNIKRQDYQVCINTFFNASDNLFIYQYGDGMGGSLNGSVAAAADTWHHIKIIFRCSDDTYDIYLNGVELDTALPFYNDRVAT
ncbi:MAG: hypothetical protein ACFFD2_15800, partial [Promethearchaeota archaeon]